MFFIKIGIFRLQDLAGEQHPYRFTADIARTDLAASDLDQILQPEKFPAQRSDTGTLSDQEVQQVFLDVGLFLQGGIQVWFCLLKADVPVVQLLCMDLQPGEELCRTGTCLLYTSDAADE